MMGLFQLENTFPDCFQCTKVENTLTDHFTMQTQSLLDGGGGKLGCGEAVRDRSLQGRQGGPVRTVVAFYSDQRPGKAVCHKELVPVAEQSYRATLGMGYYPSHLQIDDNEFLSQEIQL